jgi:adenine phosphoribosyltransferase
MLKKIFSRRQKRIDHLKKHIAVFVDHPKPGIVFQDLNPLYRDKKLYARLLKESLATIKTLGKFDYVAGIESRGFILAAGLAHRLKIGFIPIRKKGKLPGKVHRVRYALEYGHDEIEIQHAAHLKKSRILIVDDVLATGGTLSAAVQLLKKHTPHLAAFVLMDIQIGGGNKIKIPLKHLF